MSETNPAWLPIVRLEPQPDLVEQVLRIIWSYEACPVKISKSQRYRLVIEEPS